MKTYPITTPDALLRFYDAAKRDVQKQAIMKIATDWKTGKLEGIALRLEIGKASSELVYYDRKARRIIANIYTAAARDIVREMSQE